MSKDKQPRLKPEKKEFLDMRKKWSEAGQKAVEEMLKHPYSWEEKLADQKRFDQARNNRTS